MPWKKTKSGSYRTKKGGSVKRPKQYEALRKQGVSKTKAAKIANQKHAKKKKS